MKSLLLLVTVFLLFINAATAQQINTTHFSANRAPSQYTSILSGKFSKYTVVNFPSAAIAAACSSAKNDIRISLSVSPNIAFDLQLQPSGIVPADYKLYVMTEKGIDSSVITPDFLYKGVTAKGGAVRLAVRNGFISGSIHDSQKEYFIEPLKRYTDAAAEDEFIFYEAGAVTATDMVCGTTDTITEVNRTINQRIAGNTCKTASIFNLVDYSVYQHYGNSIEAVENFLLANLNNVEGLFNNLNFDAADPADTGTDYIKLKVAATCIATCPTCDFDSSINAVPVSIRLNNEFFANHGFVYPFPFIPHFWTMRQLMASGFVSGSTNSGINLMRHRSDDPLYLRLVAAHETGHIFGCAHDNDMKPGVNGFIMYAFASTNATRFSHLADFGDVNYSSNQVIKQAVLQPRSFISECTPVACDRVKDITVMFPNNTGPKISWTSNGITSVNYKLKNAQNFDAATQQFSGSGSILLNNLAPCQAYEVEIKQQCSPGNFGVATLIDLNSESLALYNINSTHLRGELFDLSCKVAGYVSSLKQAVVTIDHIPASFSIDTVVQMLQVNDLFADGARHRIDITDKNNQQYCSGPFYFTAPYYRDKSKSLLTADFADCGYPAGWTDSLAQLVPANGYGLSFGQISVPSTFFREGSIDSSCMAYCNSPYLLNGKYYLQSPIIDLTSYTNTFLHFDYNFKALQTTALPSSPNLRIEIYNGKEWKQAYSYEHTANLKPRGAYNSIWDTLPQRKFIALDVFQNKQLQIRFVIDDGAAKDTNNIVMHANTLFAFDNIVIDGYPKDGTTQSNTISIFPNPAQNEIFIKTNMPAGTLSRYRILDMIGRQCESGEIINNRIRFQHAGIGIYLLQLYDSSGVLYTGKIVRQ